MVSILDNITLRLPNAIKTHLAGKSLAVTLYKIPITIFLSGELGVGKTTFLQGFAQNLGIYEHLTSPTYALEQRYRTRDFGELLHIDLFRLSKTQAEEVASSSEDHDGIRCIEWSDRLDTSRNDNAILIEMSEDDDEVHTRNLKVTFQDIALPSPEEIKQWREEVHLPQHICEHCDAVADFAIIAANEITAQGRIVRQMALKCAAELHDIVRFVDFAQRIPVYVNEEIPSSIKTHWEQWKKRYDGLAHEAAGAAFLREKGFDALANIVTTHGLNTPNPPDMTIEQKLLFYADKRVKFTEVVTLDERFKDFINRYKGTGKEDGAENWLLEAKALEVELFGGNIPF
ncbi:tRNA (adenosine(37)-N6)-threonylcarbamoyltransferase complex ATPase subunit type 1 TsaE [Patescibacteria group bacterium]|nr:tRNA (adenosine(37)-N6)-threonylcarbamoyltransferase complex ATPase subunit type 1 TsaE [Patescibacteria group bacterium]